MNGGKYDARNATARPKKADARTPRMDRRARASGSESGGIPQTGGDVGDGPELDTRRGVSGRMSDTFAGPPADTQRHTLAGGEDAVSDATSGAANEHLQGRDNSALAARLDAALAGVVPMLPLTAEDAGALFDLIRPIAKQPLIRDVMHDHKAIIVRIFDGNRKIYERKLAVR